MTSPAGREMVLPARIELATSALPRMRSTTELRQHFHHPAEPFGLRSRAYGRARPACQGGLRPMPQFAYGAAMTSGQDDRKARLAQALRDNLRRRKAQAREEAGRATPSPANQKDQADE